MLDKYLSPEQIATLEAVRRQTGNEAPLAFGAFVDGLRTHFAAGDDPADPAVQALAQNLKRVSLESAHGDAALGQALGKMLRSEREIRERFGLDDALFAYLEKVMAIVEAQG